MLLIWTSLKCSGLVKIKMGCFSVICDNFVSGSRELTLSLLLTTLAAFLDNVDQDQTAQSMESDL